MQEDPEQVAIPDVKPDDPRTSGLVCFLNGDRECGPDCMAFTHLPSDSQHLSGQQKHCVVLVSAERLARHVVVGVKLANDAFQLFRTTAADKKRSEQPKPIDPAR